MECIDCGIPLISDEANKCVDCYDKRVVQGLYITGALCRLLRNDYPWISREALLEIVGEETYDKMKKDSERK